MDDEAEVCRGGGDFCSGQHWLDKGAAEALSAMLESLQQKLRQTTWPQGHCQGPSAVNCPLQPGTLPRDGVVFYMNTGALVLL